jgi:hypothetical protein
MFENLVDFLFIVDIFLSFRTTFVNSKTNIEIVDTKRIAMNYVYSVRFPFDILASIPLEKITVMFETESSSSNKMRVQLFGMLKLIRLFRLGRIISYMKVNAGFKVGFRIF